MIITSNGSYLLPKPFKGIGGARSSIKISGTSGTAFLKFSYKNSENTFVDLNNGAITLPFQGILEHGLGGADDYFITVTNSNATTHIIVDVGSLS